MFNHFATLLSNLNPNTVSGTVQDILLSVDGGEDILGNVEEFLSVSEYFTTINVQTLQSLFVNPTFQPVSLPKPLQRVYDVLFPPTTSTYYKQFLLHCYLHLIASTDYAHTVRLYDSRITYDLSEISGYFKFNRFSDVLSSSPAYKLLPIGRYVNTTTTVGAANAFVVSQIENSAQVLLYSITQRKYYAPGKPPSSTSADMEVTLLQDMQDAFTTQTLSIGDTGVSFSLVGVQGVTFADFTTTADKRWFFTAEAPFNFDFLEKIKTLETQVAAVDSMFEYLHTECDGSHEHLWRQHHNSVYRLVGLLLAFVSRANIVWQLKAA
jgi:hypothetical protein